MARGLTHARSDARRTRRARGLTHARRTRGARRSGAGPGRLGQGRARGRGRLSRRAERPGLGSAKAAPDPAACPPAGWPHPTRADRPGQPPRTRPGPPTRGMETGFLAAARLTGCLGLPVRAECGLNAGEGNRVLSRCQPGRPPGAACARQVPPGGLPPFRISYTQAPKCNTKRGQEGPLVPYVRPALIPGQPRESSFLLRKNSP